MSCGGNHTLIHAEPIENEHAINSVKQIKSSDTLPPLRVAKKVNEERKENIEPFTSMTSDNDYDEEISNDVKDNNIRVRVITHKKIDIYLHPF